MPQIDVLSIIKLADELEEITKTLRSGELEHRDNYVPIPSPPFLQDPDRVPMPDHRDPYGLGLQLLEQGPSSFQIDENLSEGCLAIGEKCQELAVLARAAGMAAIAGARNHNVIYQQDSAVSLINALKQVRKCMADIQKLYEELP